MAVFSAPKENLPLYAKGWYHIYAIVCEMDEGEFVVKVGVSGDPYQRYWALLPGIPFKSVMLHASVGRRGSAYRAERDLHKLFAPLRTRGEWFRFPLSEKQVFHDACRQVYHNRAAKQLEWAKITEEEMVRVMQARTPKRRKKLY